MSNQQSFVTEQKNKLVENYDEFLDASYGSIKVAGLEIKASEVLKECDPIAYRCFKADWESSF